MPRKTGFPIPILLLAALFAGPSCLRQPAQPAPALDDRPPAVEVLAAVLRAEDRGLVDDPLREACSHPDPGVREVAARALGRIGGGEAADLAGPLLADPAERVRREAVLAFGLLGTANALPQVLPLAADPSPAVRARVARALGMLQGGARNRAVLALAADGDETVAEEGCLAAAWLEPTAELATFLSDRLDDERPRVRHAAAYALARIARPAQDSPAHPVARRTLVGRAGDADPRIRLEAARGLYLPRNGAEEGALKRLAQDPERLIRIEAMISLAYPGGPPIQLLDGAAGEDVHQVLAALDGMARNRDPAVLKALADMAISPGPLLVRTGAVRALNRAAPVQAAQLLPVRLWREDDPVLRAEAARTAGLYPLEANRPVLDELLLDDIPSVRAAALEAVARREGSLAELLGATVTENHPDIRYALARAAGERVRQRRSGVRPDPDVAEEALRILADLWRRGGEDSQAFPRLAVLEAVGEGEADPAAEAILLQAAVHDDYRFRATAARWLKERYRREVPVGAASDLPGETYVDIVRWAATPREAVVTVKRAGFVPGSFTIRLDTGTAPRTTFRFARLAEAGYYDGLEFHRLVPNFIIQGGEPQGTGLGDPGFALLPERSWPPFHAGAVGMKQDLDPGAGSQFFITLTDQRRLDGRSVRIGAVTENLAGVAMLLIPGDRIVSVEIREAG